MTTNYNYFAKPLDQLVPRLYEIRKEKGWTLAYIKKTFKYPAEKIEKIELGQISLSLSDLAFLMRIYEKKINIAIVD